MSIATIRRVCSRVYGVGESRVKIMDAKRASEALTADDARQLVKDKAIVITASQSPSRSAARWKHSRIRAGRRRGEGSKKGTGISHKQKWITKVRGQRKLLSSLKSKFKQKGAFRNVYKMVKGNAFKNKHGLLMYIRDNQLANGV